METLEDVIQGLDSIHAKYSPTELVLYCFEYACRTLEKNGQNPIDYHQGFYKTMMIGEAKRLYSLASKVREAGFRPELTLPYFGVNKEWLEKTKQYKKRSSNS